ncbi:MAG: HEPN domain-containing protein [Nanoarchaeota archaeon]|nr:HEPN domain-containing protein [Nanoarchaeota archaeon]
MPHIKNKIEWCLRKAEKELQKSDKHRGLIKTKPDLAVARAHLKKAEHNLKAVTDFKNIGYSDWSASAAFYSAYHCFLAIITKFGYESRNQECTFDLIFNLIENEQIGLDKKLVEEITSIDIHKAHEEPTIVELREESQYGIKLSIEEDKFKRLLQTAKKILDKTKEIIEE